MFMLRSPVMGAFLFMASEARQEDNGKSLGTILFSGPC